VLIAVNNRSSSPDTLQLAAPDISKRNFSGPIQLNRMEVSVRTDYEQYPTSQMSRTGSFVGKEPQENYKVHEVSLDVGAKVGAESDLEK